ncbi:MAG TPA: hypothetical protein DEH40_12570 [Marinilabiliales bacterium]|nr:hypothetical protein [Marinilabiliales bacterium]
MPNKITTTVNTTDKVEYLYDAMGNKLAKRTSTATNPAVDEYYMGDVVMVRAYPIMAWNIEYLLTPEGRVDFGSGSPIYEYHLKDHLGNTRVAYIAGTSGAADAVQEADYYPFGMKMASALYENNTNKYLYNGKELQDNTLGNINLDWYDYGARFYDPSLGRWHVMDKVAESYFGHSPYSNCFNNPIKYHDPNGMWPEKVHNRMIEETFKGTLTTNEIAILMQASKYADIAEFQDTDDSYRHAMGQEGLSTGASMKLYDNFINQQLDNFINTSDPNAALFELGIALHAMMDNASPTHNGFQVWKGIKKEKNFGLTHFFGEQMGAYEDPANQPDIVLAKQEMLKLIRQAYDIKYGGTLIPEVTVTANRTNKKEKSNEERMQDMLWQSVRPNANGNTGRYNKPGRSSDQNYSDEFLKWYYDK